MHYLAQMRSRPKVFRQLLKQLDSSVRLTRLLSENGKLPEMELNPDTCPPDLSLSVMGDVARLVNVTASKYVDPTCPLLSFEDLVGGGMEKFATVVDQGDLVWRMTNRREFFKFVKTAVNNHVKGIVSRQRFTVKRTGIRPPARGEITDAPTKPIEMSLDDPESGLQIGDVDEDHISASELLEDIEYRLSPLERLVLHQLVEPNDAARFICDLESNRGRKLGSVKVTMDTHHKAQGLGMSTDLFLEIQARIRKVTLRVKHETGADQSSGVRYLTAISALEKAFGITVPTSYKTLDASEDRKLMVRRTFSVAALRHFDRVKKSPELVTLLNTVGAKVADTHSSQATCYGILFEDGHQICNVCSLKDTCRVEAAQVGLGKIVISPRLIGAKAFKRVPAIIPTVRPQESGVTEVVDDFNSGDSFTEVSSYLNENFRSSRHGQTQIYFKHKEGTKYIFCMIHSGRSLKLRFCKPSASLSARLHRGYLKPEEPAAAAIQMIDEHARDTYAS